MTDRKTFKFCQNYLVGLTKNSALAFSFYKQGTALPSILTFYIIPYAKSFFNDLTFVFFA